VSAGYSGTPLPRKLGIKPGHRVLVLGAPDGFEDGALGPLPDGVRVARRASGTADVIVSFHVARAELARRMPRLRERMDPAAGLWVAWPKRASGMDTDLTETSCASSPSPTRSWTTRCAPSTPPGAACGS
jgi:hypothetical protein